MARFWWGSDASSGGMHWFKWEELGKPKCRGGLGFRRLEQFNQALLAKQVWNMMVHPTSLVARVFKARYFRHTTLSEAGLGSNPSLVWRSLLWARTLTKRGLLMRVGDGASINLFLDPWIPGLRSGYLTNRGQPISTVAQLIKPNRTWDTQLLNQVAMSFERDEVAKIPLPMDAHSDTIFWRYE